MRNGAPRSSAARLPAPTVARDRDGRQRRLDLLEQALGALLDELREAA
jgi:hypothetical protein